MKHKFMVTVWVCNQPFVEFFYWTDEARAEFEDEIKESGVKYKIDGPV